MKRKNILQIKQSETVLFSEQHLQQFVYELLSCSKKHTLISSMYLEVVETNYRLKNPSVMVTHECKIEDQVKL